MDPRTTRPSSAKARAAYPPANLYLSTCPSRRLLELIADKWALLLLPALIEGPKRNGELMRRLEGVSQKMLTQTLRDLERNGLVDRRDYQEVPPRVEYRLTELGHSLAKTLRLLDSWIEDHYVQVLAARDEFERRPQPSRSPVSPE